MLGTGTVLYPVFLDLAGRRCLVVGAGSVGLARVRGLLDAGAAVTVVEPRPAADLLALRQEAGELRIEARAFRPGDAAGFLLVHACTSSAATNALVAEDAAAHGALCTRADDSRAGGDFRMAAVLRRGDVCVAVSSGGRAPALAAEARDRVASVVGEEFGAASGLLGRLRIEARERGVGAPQRRRLAQRALDAGLLALLRDGHRERAESLVAGLLAEACAAGEAPQRDAVPPVGDGLMEDPCTR